MDLRMLALPDLAPNQRSIASLFFWLFRQFLEESENGPDEMEWLFSLAPQFIAGLRRVTRFFQPFQRFPRPWPETVETVEIIGRIAIPAMNCGANEKE